MSEDLNPINVLRQDHRVVLGKLDVMDEAIKNLNDKESIQIPKDIITFLTGEVVVHFAKEEEAFFPEIEKFIPREGGPTGMMLIEHEELNNSKTNFIKGVEELSKNADSMSAKELITKNGGHFTGLLREHIYKEDNILFMMAEMHLDTAQINNISKLFDEIDKRYIAGRR